MQIFHLNFAKQNTCKGSFAFAWSYWGVDVFTGDAVVKLFNNSLQVLLNWPKTPNYIFYYFNLKIDPKREDMCIVTRNEA